MRIGCCLNLIAPRPGTVGDENIEILTKAGFDYIELPLAETAALSEDDFAALHRRLDKNGISCESCNNFLPRTARVTGPSVDMDAVLAYVEKAFSRAQTLGVSRVVFGSPGAKNLPDGFPREEGFNQIVAFLKRVDSIAAKHGITIAIEPICKAEANIINTFEEGCRLAQAADCANVRVLVDYFHMRTENEPVGDLLSPANRYLAHVHFARFDGRGFPKDFSEDSHYAEFFSALKTICYDARISVEALSKNLEEDAADAVAFFRNIYK